MNDLRELLTVPRHAGYPTEYLLARLRARRITFAENCETAIESDAWQILQQEFCWMYRQMDYRLRNTHAPVFIHFELHTLFTALRFKSSGNIGSITNTIRHSLLCDRIKNILINNKTFPENIGELREFLSPFHKRFAELEKSYRSKGLIGVEKSFQDIFRDGINSNHYPKIICDFLNSFEYRRNLLTLAKQKLWQLETTSLLPKDRKEKKEKTLHDLLKKHPQVSDSPARLDALLLRMMKRRYQQLGRVWEPLAQIISHLCSCYLIARDAGLKPLTGLLGENRISREIT